MRVPAIRQLPCGVRTRRSVRSIPGFMEIILSHLGFKSNIQFCYCQLQRRGRKETVRELVARGGDGILYLNLHSAESIGVVVKEVKAPVSILAGPQSPSVSELQDLGVAQVMTDLFLSNREIGVAVIGGGIVSRAGDANTIVASGGLCCRSGRAVRSAT